MQLEEALYRVIRAAEEKVVILQNQPITYGDNHGLTPDDVTTELKNLQASIKWVKAVYKLIIGVWP